MKLALLNCYFGNLPNYFELWLQSCKYNPQIDFIFITDANIDIDVPCNVKVVAQTWDGLVQFINSKFNFEISIQSPYKLTDFKPAYGYIFEDYFKGYDYWGYCDIDLIFGNILRFIEKPMQQKVEKIYRLGHLTIYKNTERMKYLFKQKGAMFSYREVFSSPEFYSFDEHAGQMLIAKRQKVCEYYQEDMADISCRINRLTASRQKNYTSQVFYFDKGNIYRAYVKDQTVITEEFVYIHMQKRKYIYEEQPDCFYILGGRFVSKTLGVPNVEEIKQLSEYVSSVRDVQQLAVFRLKKVLDFMKSSFKQKGIWMKIKLAENQF